MVLQTAVKSLFQPQLASCSSVLMAPQEKSAVLHQRNSSNLLQVSNLQPLPVNLPPLQNISKSVLPVSLNANTLRRKPAVIGKKSTADGSLKLKVFTAPRTFYFYEGNLDVSVKSEYLTDYLKKLEYMSISLHVALSIRPDLWIHQLFALYLLMFKLTLKTKTK